MNASDRAEASASSGFYRPPVTERNRWASPFSGGGNATSKPWLPKAFLSPEARKWALKTAALAVLVATSVALHGRVIEGLQDLAGFHLAEVKVSGVHYLSEDEVKAASALKPGDGMFHLDLKTAAEKVGRLPWVKNVMFERRLPQNILISVEERRPAALVDAGTLWGVDDEGRLLPPSTALLNEDLPLISGVPVRAEDAGNTRSAENFKPAIGFLAFLKKEDPALYSDVSEVQAAHADDLRVTFLDGTMARFGSDAGEDELRHMAAVLSDLSSKNQHATVLDFRFKDQVVVRTR
jgi:cell division protein FtsQ